MSDNNYQNGYPQQNMYGQPQQNMYTQPQQNMYTQPPKPPKKSKTGLVIGIIIALVLVAAGGLLFAFRDTLFGPKVKGGYDSAEAVCTAFWEGFSMCDRDKLETCFPECIDNIDEIVDNNYAKAVDLEEALDINVKDMEVTTSSYSKDKIKGLKVKDAKAVHMEVPMTQTVGDTAYEIVDIYDGVVVQLKKNKKWYFFELSETDVQIIDEQYIGDENVEEEITEEITEDTEEDIEDYTTEEIITEGDADAATFGDSVNGYADMPSNWISFYEEGGIDGTYSSTQYSAPDQSAILTMCTYENMDDPEAAAMNVYTFMESEGAQELTAATVYIGGYEAKQVYGYYTDEDLYLVTYMFMAPDVDDLLHYVALEFHPGMEDLVLSLEGTYRFEY